MICKKSHRTPRSVAARLLPCLALLALASCSLNNQEDDDEPGGSSPSGPPVPPPPTVNAGVVAHSDLRGVVVGATTSVPQGTDLSSASFAVSNSGMAVSSNQTGSARGQYGLTANGQTVVFQIEEEAISDGSESMGTIGTHETMLTLYTTEPVSGTLTIDLVGTNSSNGGAAWTMVDLGNNGYSEIQTGFLNQTFTEAVTVDGVYEIRTTTRTHADTTSSILRMVTLTFQQ